jgi:hypothetical protein
MNTPTMNVTQSREALPRDTLPRQEVLALDWWRYLTKKTTPMVIATNPHWAR